MGEEGRKGAKIPEGLTFGIFFGAKYEI